MRLKVLVTGAGGRIARWIIPLLASKFDLHLTDRNATEVEGLPVSALDITDYAAVRAAMEGMDAVVHLAIASNREFRSRGKDIGPDFIAFNDASIDVNVRGSYYVIQAAKDANVRRIVLGSSLTIFLGDPRPAHFTDDNPSNPVNFYAVTKLWTEQIGELFSRLYDLKVYCLRFGSPYPQPDHTGQDEWLRYPAGRRSSVTFVDLAGSVECALTAENGPNFGAYMIISNAEGSIYDCSKAEEIGWRSRTRCEEDGSITPLD